jgi:hypothetical protein
MGRVIVARAVAVDRFPTSCDSSPFESDGGRAAVDD